MGRRAGIGRARGAGLTLLLWGVVLPAGAWAVAAPAGRGLSGTELTIRNSTREPIAFRIKLFDSARQQPETVLAPGSLARFPGAIAFDLTFESGGRRLEYRLDPGLDYAFRYDSEEQVDLFLGSHGREDAPTQNPHDPEP